MSQPARSANQVTVVAIPMGDQEDGFTIECSACGVVSYVGHRLVDLYARAHLQAHGVQVISQEEQ